MAMPTNTDEALMTVGELARRTIHSVEEAFRLDRQVIEQFGWDAR